MINITKNSSFDSIYYNHVFVSDNNDSAYLIRKNFAVFQKAETSDYNSTIMKHHLWF